ncbi:MAG: hypothetical protein AAF609_26600 [Cyanobacteria bacterium P01_C01_bin.120]
MTQKIAIAVIHGIGKARDEFADPQARKYLSGISPRIRKAFSKELKDILPNAGGELVFKPVCWANVVQRPQDELYERLGIKKFSQFFGLRDFVFHSFADSVAYPLTTGDSHI